MSKLTNGQSGSIQIPDNVLKSSDDKKKILVYDQASGSLVVAETLLSQRDEDWFREQP